MARTDKDTPWQYKSEEEIRRLCVHGKDKVWTSSNYRKTRKKIKRQGHKSFRNGATKFWDVKTVRALSL